MFQFIVAALVVFGVAAPAAKHYTAIVAEEAPIIPVVKTVPVVYATPVLYATPVIRVTPVFHHHHDVY